MLTYLLCDTPRLMRARIGVDWRQENMGYNMRTRCHTHINCLKAKRTLTATVTAMHCMWYHRFCCCIVRHSSHSLHRARYCQRVVDCDTYYCCKLHTTKNIVIPCSTHPRGMPLLEDKANVVPEDDPVVLHHGGGPREKNGKERTSC